MSAIWTRLVALLAANRVVMAVTGWGVWFASSFLFDDVLYPAMIAWLGPILGGGVMAIIAMNICWFWMQRVVVSEKDWFDMATMHRIQRIVFWVVRITKHLPFVRQSWVDKVEFLLTFCALNVLFDPMIATLYFRRNNRTSALSKNDIKIFLWSGVVSNGYWILRSWGLVALIKLGWQFFAR